MKIRLEPVTVASRAAVERLETAPGQEGFVESVAECLAEADRRRCWRPVGVYDGDALIGFAMYGFFWEYLPFGRLWLDRLLIDRRFQGRDFDTEHYYINLDLKPALDEEKLDRRLLRDFEENANRDFHNVLEGLVPRLMVPVLVERTGIPAAEKVHSVTKAQRRRLLEVLKCLRIDIQGPRPVEEAIVTSGGIKVSEINPTTLESKKAPGVYFAGEVLDVDAYTGGFNLQIAWSTGHAAGEAAAQDIGGINP